MIREGSCLAMQRRASSALLILTLGSSAPARQHGRAVRRARRDVVRCQAAREAGTILREVLTRSERYASIKQRVSCSINHA